MHRREKGAMDEARTSYDAPLVHGKDGAEDDLISPVSVWGFQNHGTRSSNPKTNFAEKERDGIETNPGPLPNSPLNRKSVALGGVKTHNKLLASLKFSASPSFSRPQAEEESDEQMPAPQRSKSKVTSAFTRHQLGGPETDIALPATNERQTGKDETASEHRMKEKVPKPPMKRFAPVSQFGAESANKEVVLHGSSVKPSAAFPAGTDKIGPHSFRKLKLLGKGGAGTVYLVVLRGTDSVYAMKELTKEDMIKRKKVMRVMTEREILTTANHPFIVTMYATFQTHHRLCFVMDFCAGGEFFGVLSRQPQQRLQEKAARFYAAEVLLALEYLHYLGFFYRDLKPENILMRDNGHIALTDFDLSKQAQAVSPRMVEHHRTVFEKFSNMMSGKSSSKLGGFEIVDSEPVLEADSTSFVGTLEYLAPELVKGEAQGSAVDWWTFGILIYEMMTGTTPFRAKTSEEVLANITGSDRIHWEGDIGSSEARKIVRKLLKRDQKKRLGAENGATDIKNHPWFSCINFSLIRNDQPPIVPTDVPSLDDFEGVDLDKGSDSDASSSSSEDEAFADFKMKRSNVAAY